MTTPALPAPLPAPADHAAMVKRLEDRYLFTGTFKPAQK
jgi:hypothetical protein